MKRSIIAIALLCLCGCSEKPVEPREHCQEFVEFANWVQKAHPDIWREYNKTICEE